MIIDEDWCDIFLRIKVNAKLVEAITEGDIAAITEVIIIANDDKIIIDSKGVNHHSCVNISQFLYNTKIYRY